MKNKEKYAKEIIEIVMTGDSITVNKENKPCSCNTTKCENCLFFESYEINTGCNRVKCLSKWAEEEYHESILNEVEKKYLSGVTKPFRDLIISIHKEHLASCHFEYIIVDTISEAFTLSGFYEGTMYQGMEENKKYTLEELGL